MERIVLLLVVVFAVGVHSRCKVIEGPDDVAVTTGDTAKMSCTVQNPNQVTWLRTDQKNSNQPVYVWYDEESMDRDVFDVATRTSGSSTIYELMINVNKDTAGTYSCGCAGKDTKSAVLTVLDDPVCYQMELDPKEGEAVDIRCRVNFVSTANDPEVYFVDYTGPKMDGDQTEETDENGNILITMDSRLIAKWEDNERDYICYSTVDNINNQECILTLDVQHVAENFSLIPNKNIYYRGEKLTVFFHANPDANTIKWTHLNTETVIEKNAESITIPSTWSGDTELQVDVANTMDATNYTVSHTFRFTVGEGSGAYGVHNVAVLLFTTLLLIISINCI